jgi:4-amino-4-deoxy-L-arabinose transferase-like glycosyltransferase
MTSTLSDSAAIPGYPAAAPYARPGMARRSSFLVRLVRGREDDAVWARPALLGLLAATALLYLWGLGASGWANAFYSAAAQAGSASWKALFFGSSDASNSITVDKTPASLWVMALSVRMFGLSSWSVLVPQALEGVAAVGLLYATVRRWFGPGAGLLAGAVLAATPVAVLMFRFNNPDALLVLLLVAGAYATMRAVETASTKWLMLAASAVGFGFLTKMLQALLVVPAFALVYLIAAPTGLRRRLGQLALAGLALVLSAGWWIAIVSVIPAQYRPYIGGSQHNSILELTLGYNGFGRLTGNETGSVGGGAGGGWGQTGWTRMFDSEIGGQVAWLLPAALILLVAGLALSWRTARTDRTRAAFVLWGGWLLITGLVFSFMQGIFHAYYTVALAPAIGAVVGMGAAVLWRRRKEQVAAITLAATVAITSWWSFTLLGRSTDWHPWLRVVVLVLGLGSAGLLLLISLVPKQVTGLVAATAIAASLAGPVGYSLNTASSAHTGAIPTAGPAVVGAGFGGGGPGGGRGQGGPGGGFGGRPGGTANGGFNGGTTNGGTTNGGTALGGGNGGPGGGMAGGGIGGLLNANTPSSELVALLKKNASSYAWAAAAVGSNNAAGYQLASQEAVMAIGGFNGSDPSPTLAEFQQYVKEGKIHYFIGGTLMQSASGSNTSQQIAQWVANNYTATTVGNVTVYDLTAS